MRPSNTPECLRQLCGRLPPGMLRISAATSNRAAAAAAAARYDTLCRDDERCLSPPPIPHQLRNAEQFTTTIYRSDFLVHVVTPHATPSHLLRVRIGLTVVGRTKITKSYSHPSAVHFVPSTRDPAKNIDARGAAMPALTFPRARRACSQTCICKAPLAQLVMCCV